MALRHPDDVFLHGMDFPYRFLRQPDLSAPDTRQLALLWQTVLCFRLEAAPASYGKHGFTRGAQHPHRLLFSTFNTFFGEMVWGARGIEWHTYFDASVMIITFVLTGRCPEEKAKDSTASSIRQLMGMQPKTARLVTREKMEGTNDYKMEEVPISTIQIGDMIEVRAGEKIPVDGVVTRAESFMTADAAYVDEAMISGEPTPAMKKAGDNVLAGTIPSRESSA